MTFGFPRAAQRFCSASQPEADLLARLRRASGGKPEPIQSLREASRHSRGIAAPESEGTRFLHEPLTGSGERFYIESNRGWS